MQPVDLIVVGAGPAGRALAHRAERAGLRVTLVDPAPERPWTATYGLYADDAPAWLDRAVVAARSENIVVYTPHRSVVDREYLVLDPEALRRSLPVSDVLAQAAVRFDGASVTLADGTERQARTVVDARGTGVHPAASTPRQTAYGVFLDSREPAETEAVLMDWRAAGVSALRPASFSYRVPTKHGLLVEETCLAGRPPIPLDELRRRRDLRGPTAPPDARVETVDFPMFGCARPWRHDGPLLFGAVGGMMNPATGYSVAQSLGAVDGLVDALLGARDPRARLWSRSARAVHVLRLLGLSVLLSLPAEALVVFFDAFFKAPVARQRAYLSARDDLRGVLLAMLAVFLRCPPRVKWLVVVASVRCARLRAV